MIVYACNRSMRFPRKRGKRKQFVPKNMQLVPVFRAPDNNHVRSLLNDQWACDAIIQEAFDNYEPDDVVEDSDAILDSIITNG